MSCALAGVRVLDLCDRSAALAGRILADLGAEVVLVEPPEGSPIRRLAPFLHGKPGVERSLHHQYLSANKKSVVIRAPGPLTESDAFRALVSGADLLLETARPGTRRGLDHAELRALNPRLVQISVTPFGLDDAAGRKATDIVAGAAGGLLHVSGDYGGPPVHGAAHPSFCMGGLVAASAALIALTRRAGAVADEAIHVDVSLQEATLLAVMQTANAPQWTWHGRIPTRPGLSSAIRCADGGHVGLLVRPDRFREFLAWCDRVGVEHGMTPADWKWSRLDAPRKGNPVSAAILKLAAALPRDAFVDGAFEADVVCLPVLDFPDIARHPQFAGNDQFLEVEHAVLGALGFVRSPVAGLADGVTIRRAPHLGEHDAEILPSRQSVAARGDSAPPADPARALEGIRVVDFGWVLAAPIGTRLLASFGAEVIRIESRRKPDSMRSQIGPKGVPDSDLGGLFNTVNAGKKSLSVDLSTARGVALVKDLIARSDVVVNNFRPGALARMGFGYPVLRELNPGIVLLNLPGAHPKGPWAARGSMGNILMSASGFNMLTGFPGTPPRGIGIAYPDFVAPHLLASCVLAALRERRRTGVGQEIQAVQLSGILSLLGVEWMQYRSSGAQPPRNANRDPNACPHGAYPTAGEGEWLALAVTDEEEWRGLCRALQRPGLIADPRFASHAARKANEDALDEVVAAWTRTHDKWAGAEHLQAEGVPAAPVEDLRDTLERDPVARRHYQVVRQPAAPDVDIPIDAEAARWVGADLRLRRAPSIGEHNEEIVRGLLGYDEAAYARLVLDGVLE